MAEDKIIRLGLAVMIMDFKKEKILMGRRKNVRGDGLLAFPGGHLEYGETFIGGSLREAREETGPNMKIRILGSTPDVVESDILPDDDKHYVILFMRARYISGHPINMEPDKCEEWEWVDWYGRLGKLFPPIQRLRNRKYNPFKQ